MKSIRNAVVGATLLIIIVFVTVAWYSAGTDAPDDAAENTARWLQLSRSQAGEITQLKGALVRADVAVQDLERRVRPGVAQLHADVAAIHVDTRVDSGSLVGGLTASGTVVSYTVPSIRDTAHMSTVQRPGVDLHAWLVPTFFVESWKHNTELAFALDSLSISYSGRYATAVQLIAAQDRRHASDSGAIWWLKAENRQRRDRCGRRCGIVIGVASTMVVAVAANQVGALLNGRPRRPP